MVGFRWQAAELDQHGHVAEKPDRQQPVVSVDGLENSPTENERHRGVSENSTEKFHGADVGETRGGVQVVNGSSQMG